MTLTCASCSAQHDDPDLPLTTAGRSVNAWCDRCREVSRHLVGIPAAPPVTLDEMQAKIRHPNRRK